jgi:hypothetical protein
LPLIHLLIHIVTYPHPSFHSICKVLILYLYLSGVFIYCGWNSYFNVNESSQIILSNGWRIDGTITIDPLIKVFIHSNGSISSYARYIATGYTFISFPSIVSMEHYSMITGYWEAPNQGSKGGGIYLKGRVIIANDTRLWIDTDTITVTPSVTTTNTSGHIYIDESTTSSLLTTPSSSIRRDINITSDGLINGIPVQCGYYTIYGIHTLNSESLLIIPSHITKILPLRCPFTGLKTSVVLSPATTLDIVCSFLLLPCHQSDLFID